MTDRRIHMSMLSPCFDVGSTSSPMLAVGPASLNNMIGIANNWIQQSEERETKKDARIAELEASLEYDTELLTKTAVERISVLEAEKVALQKRADDFETLYKGYASQVNETRRVLREAGIRNGDHPDDPRPLWEMAKELAEKKKEIT